ncbi:MAG: CAP domain-containing protein [Akkermansiaceae bacterium]
MKLFLLSLTFCLLNHVLLRGEGEGNEILAALQNRIDNNGDVSEIYGVIEDLPNSEAKLLFKRINRAWPSLRDKYISSFQRTARASSGDTKDHKNRIRDLRAQLAGLKTLQDGPMKTALKKKGMPALNELRTILMPNVKSIMATADKEFKKERRTIVAIAGLRDTLIEVAIIPNNQSSISEITEKEQESMRELSGLDRKGLKIMYKNRKTSEKEKVPEAERIGVEDANIMRLLAGYNALEIDPKLCATSRDHSKDMEKHQFFAHNSPVAGKRTPWDRAKNFGTTASGENIYMGSTKPQAANRGWFFSPGHHRNMFNPSHKRIGLGQHNRHWTQMFGR